MRIHSCLIVLLISQVLALIMKARHSFIGKRSMTVECLPDFVQIPILGLGLAHPMRIELCLIGFFFFIPNPVDSIVLQFYSIELISFFKLLPVEYRIC